MLNLNRHYPKNFQTAEEPTAHHEQSLWAAALLLILVIALLAFGLIMVQSTTAAKLGNALFNKQCLWAGVGIVLLIGTCIVGPHRITNWKFIILLLLGTWVLLLAARFVFPPINGAYRWVQIGNLGNIQPSEIAKFAVILLFARWTSDNVRNIDSILTSYYNNVIELFKNPNLRSFAFVAPPLVFVLTLGLVFLGKDLGMSLLMSATVTIMTFIAGLHFRYMLLIGAGVLVGVAALCLDKDSFRYKRIIAFLDPEAAGAAGMQIWMSLLALGSGGYMGRGLGEGRLKTGYLPEDHTDCILSIAGEELGFIGMATLIVVFILILITCTIISVQASTRTLKILGAGFTVLLGLQMLMNVAVITSSIPAKGMPAPFISYGGSNLVTSLLAIGIIIAIAIDTAFPHFYANIFNFLSPKNNTSPTA